MTKVEMSQAIRNQPCATLWYGIKSRCYNEKNVNYKNYGGRGIIMQDSWVLNFGAFQEYVMSLEGYDKRESHSLTLDRIDNNRGYEEGNLRWATKKEQSNNQKPYGSNPIAPRKPYKERNPNESKANRQSQRLAALSSQLFK